MVQKKVNTNDIIVVGCISLLAGGFIQLPSLIPAINQGDYYSNNLWLIFALSISAYFIYKYRPEKKYIFMAGAVFLLSFVFMNLFSLLEKFTYFQSESYILSSTHLLFLLWGTCGLLYINKKFKSAERIIEYLKLNGEILVYTLILGAGGVVFTWFTMFLFSSANLNIQYWYFKWIVPFGIAACPIVGTFLADISIFSEKRISPLLAKIFSPLFLFTLLIYIVAVIGAQKDPFLDRNFFISMNGMLFIILALSIFTVADQKEDTKNFSNYINTGLLGIAFLIGLVALTATIYRISSYGFSPNKIAVFGANVLFLGHTGLLAYANTQFILGKLGIKNVQNWLTKYMFAYIPWLIFVIFILPLIFNFY